MLWGPVDIGLPFISQDTFGQMLAGTYSLLEKNNHHLTKGRHTMNYLGIDVSKSTSRYVLLDSDGEKAAKPFTLDNNQQAFTQLLERLKELNLLPGEPARQPDGLLIGIEATGIWWENLYCFMTEQKFKVIVLNPHQTNKFREALRLKAKTDDIDAYVIAGLLRSGEYAASYIPEETIQILREIVKLRHQLVTNRQSFERQAHALLGLLFPEYEKTAIKNPFAISSLAILKAYPTAKHLAEAKPKNIEKIVRSIVGNNFNIAEIKTLIETARNSIYSGRAKDARGMNLNIILTHVETLHHSIAQLDKRMDDILSPQNPDDANSFPGANVLSIPGVGPKTLAAILSVVGADGALIRTAKALSDTSGFSRGSTNPAKHDEITSSPNADQTISAARFTSPPSLALNTMPSLNPFTMSKYHRARNQNKPSSA